MLIENIAGQMTAKRAMEVAAAGGHSILFVGAHGAGKDCLVEAFDVLKNGGPARAHAVLCCWCGNDGLTEECQCSERGLIRYARRLHKIARDTNADIILEVTKVPSKEFSVSPNDRDKTADAKQRALNATVLAMRNRSRWNVDLNNIEQLMKMLDDAGNRVVEMAVRRLGWGVGDTLRALRVARTIADLNGHIGITGKDIAEAVQYRALPQMKQWGNR